MDEDRTSTLQYVILPAKPGPGSAAVELQNKAYDYWVGFWGKVFENNNAGRVNFHGEFFRMDAITAVFSGEDIVAMHLYCFFNLRLRAHQEHPYFHGVSGAEAYLGAMRTAAAERVMSMEYLTVDPGWRKHRLGVSLASVLISLGTRIQTLAGADASTGIARRDVGVDLLGQEVGGVEIAGGGTIYNTPVSLMCMYSDRLKELYDPAARALAGRLWETKIDWTGQYAEKPRLKLVA